MNPGYLMLHPATDQPLPEISPLLARLAETGFIGQAVPDTPHCFRAGANFLQRLTFLGCSPNLPLDGDQHPGEALCTIRLLGPFPSAVLISGENCRPPRCRACRHPLPEWRIHIGTANNGIRCPGCGRESGLRDLNWRQMGGTARLFIAISQVFPGEAVPTAGLMQTLRQEGGEWDYFYAQQPRLWHEGGEMPGF
jgi:hypothetical protein